MMKEKNLKSEAKSQSLLSTGNQGRGSCCHFFFLGTLVLTLVIFSYVNFLKLPTNWTSALARLVNQTNISKSTYFARPPVPMMSMTPTTNPSQSSGSKTTLSYYLNNILYSSSRQDNVSAVKTSTAPWKPLKPYHVAYPHAYTFIVNEPESCKNEHPFLVLMVPVAPGNRASRDAIRRTWGSEKSVLDKVVKQFFMLGLPGSDRRETLQENVLQESKEHHDILQSDFLDSYFNLTIKTMVMLEWLSDHCNIASYAMKIDSDMFLNVNALVQMLIQAPKGNYLTGLVEMGARVLRNPGSKWYLPEDVFPEHEYPPYALGLGYVLSMDLPKKLIEGSKHVGAIYIEDVYVGLCMRYLGIPVTNPPTPDLFHVFPVPFERCHYSKIIASTTKGIRDQENFWRELKEPGPACP